MKNLPLAFACLALLTACGIKDHVPVPERPQPPQVIENYNGMAQKDLLAMLGPADKTDTNARGETYLLYHWHTRDAVKAPRMQHAWRGNTVFTQRQLPTNDIPLRDACDIVFVTNGKKVLRTERQGLCW